MEAFDQSPQGGGLPGTAFSLVYERLARTNIGGAIALCGKFYLESQFNGPVRFSVTRAAAHLSMFVSRDDCRGWVARDPETEEVHGFLLAQYDRPWFSPDPVIFEQGFFVRAEKRAHGVGRQLLEALHRWAEETDAKYIQVAATSGIDDDAIDTFLRKHGYTARGTAYWRPL